MLADSNDHRRMRRRILAGLGAFFVVARAGAQSSGATRVTLIVPAPGGVSGDRLGQIVAEALSRILEVPVRVENIGGDSGVVGTNAIAAGARDGSLLGIGMSVAMVGGRLLSRNARFNPIDDFQWFTIIGTYPTAMVVAGNAPQKDIASWVASAREAATPLVYASVGTGSAGHLAGGFLRAAQGARLVHRSVEAPEERYALLADGKIAAVFDGIPNALLEAPSAGCRIIAVTSAERTALLPDVPSFGELWQQSFDTWFGLIAPKGLDNSAYFRLASAVGVLIGDARFVDSMRAAGVSFLGLSGRGTQAFLDTEILRGAKLIAQLSNEGMRN
ncbi:MAG TPA: tripartite tricarboxylate transporter substrate binding protein [Casimicrobiaceae bacterium]|nr:tripartite tricarboxylate transporter substrate binding protein [Casimicrobiaceae bacterium]